MSRTERAVSATQRHPDNPSQAYLRKSILDVLLSGPLKKIDYSCAGIHVTAGALFSVYWPLVSYQISVKIDPKMSAGVAFYSPLEDAYIVGKNDFARSQPAEKALIAHETVHAMMDLAHLAWSELAQNADRGGRGNPGVTTVTAEATAYVAQSLYSAFDGRYRPENTNPILKLSDTIAAKIMDTPGASISDKDIDKLRETIYADPVYHERIKRQNMFQGNGLDISGERPF
jgi:hypothetical protein